VGDTVNLSARLQQWATAGEIVLSEPTHAAVAGTIECEPMEPAQVKGRQAMVVAYKVPAE
ncbi:MAG: Adenylate and Guanylate cyclase catalytic domain, partial [Actinomycetota bacterium]|nr:Adenylate and Guanylate cyclase catalytic domain [Actinomycetota bacterium]